MRTELFTVLEQMSVLVDRLQDVGLDIDNEAWYNSGPHFTCAEVETLAAVLNMIDDEAGAALIQGHGETDDDPDDTHHHIYLEHRTDVR